jgi:hypothetical protein
MDCFIVRIYRREENDPQGVCGLVETVGRGDKKSFAGSEELWNIISSNSKKKRPIKGLSFPDVRKRT